MSNVRFCRSGVPSALHHAHGLSGTGCWNLILSSLNLASSQESFMRQRWATSRKNLQYHQHRRRRRPQQQLIPGLIYPLGQQTRFTLLQYIIFASRTGGGPRPSLKKGFWINRKLTGQCRATLLVCCKFSCFKTATAVFLQQFVSLIFVISLIELIA